MNNKLEKDLRVSLGELLTIWRGFSGHCFYKADWKIHFFPLFWIAFKLIYCILFLDVIFLVLSSGSPQFFLFQDRIFCRLVLDVQCRRIKSTSVLPLLSIMGRIGFGAYERLYYRHSYAWNTPSRRSAVRQFLFIGRLSFLSVFRTVGWSWSLSDFFRPIRHVESASELVGQSGHLIILIGCSAGKPVHVKLFYWALKTLQNQKIRTARDTLKRAVLEQEQF